MRQWRHRSELRGGCLPPYLCLPFGVKIVYLAYKAHPLLFEWAAANTRFLS
jgi:hypothetical protein